MTPADDRPVILVVDDDRETCALLARLLEGQGYATRQATSGGQCLAIVAREPVTLLLLDVVMPGMDGFAVCKALRATPHGRRLHPRPRARGAPARPRRRGPRRQVDSIRMWAVLSRGSDIAAAALLS
jgi:CheY-like chemotaxis protein